MRDSYLIGVITLLFFTLINFLLAFNQIDFPVGVLYIPVLLYIHYNMQGMTIPGNIIIAWSILFILLTAFHVYAHYINGSEEIINVYRICYLLVIVIMFIGCYVYIIFNRRKWSEPVDPLKYRFIIIHCNMLLMIAILLLLLVYHEFTPSTSEFYSRLSLYAVYVLVFLNILLKAHYIVVSTKKRWFFKDDLTGDGNERSMNLPLSLLIKYEEDLKNIMETEKLYLSPNMSIDLLVKKTNIPRHHLSEFFNSYLQKDFYHFIAEYRIAHAADYLEKNKDNLTIEGLAYECGFNSKTTFNKYFKEIKGCPLSEYKINHKNEIYQLN